MKVYILLLSLIVSGFFNQGISQDTLIKQRINYKTDKAKEVYLVWAMDNWKTPDQKFWTKGTYINNGMAYSPMQKTNNNYFIELKLPKGIYMDFMIWVSKDKEGHASESWDNNWGANYNLFIDGAEKEQVLTDEKLYVVEKVSKPFSFLENGWIILLGGFLLLVCGAVYIFFKRRSFQKIFSANAFIAGSVFAILLLMILLRLQLNDILIRKQYLFLGAGYYDLIFMVFAAGIIGLSLFLVRKKRIARIFLQCVSGLFLFVVLVAAILNMEVVRQIGKPLTYNWLYYSDFMQANDAKNAVRAGLSPVLVKNIIYIITGVLLGALGISLMNRFNFFNSKRSLLITAGALLIIFSISIFQLKTNQFDLSKTQNPLTALVGSWVNAARKPSIFKLKVPVEISTKIEEMHRAGAFQKDLSADSINNVVVFVMESTPSNLVQVFDSTYKVTPNLLKWSKNAKVFTNAYAHLPTTVNTMSSIVSGVYPMISYKTIVNEYPDFHGSSLPGILKDNGWKTSLFFSSDLTYSNMELYLKNQKLEMAEDFKTIGCKYEKFNSSYAQLDGLDDRCIVNRYLDWRNKSGNRKTFSILWTNQTHYPYFFAGDEKKFTQNKELNKYLNALEEVDQALGDLMSGLESSGQLKNTLVIVMGDHGEAFGTHDQYTHAANIYEENLKVPLLLINPFLFHGESDSKLAATIDIAPTVAHITGVTSSKDWQGSSLLDPSKRDHNFFIGPYSDFLFGSRFGKWKFIFNATLNQYMLFDLEKDPGELKNVADENPAIIKTEKMFLAGWVKYHTQYISKYLN